MTRFLARSTLVFALLASLSMPAAHAITDNVFRYSQPRTGSLMLGPADFAPENDTVPYARVSGVALTTIANDTVCFHGTAHLPNLATITELKLFYSRPTESDLIYVNMRRVATNGGPPASIVNYPPSPPPVAQRGNAAYPANAATNVVNTHRFRYDVEVCIRSDAQLYNVHVGYTYTQAGD